MLTAPARADVLAQPLARRRDGCHGAVQPRHALAEALAAGAQLGAHARRDGCERLAVGPGLQGVGHVVTARSFCFLTPGSVWFPTRVRKVWCCGLQNSRAEEG